MDQLDRLKTKFGFAPGAGFVKTTIPAVRFFWSTEPVPRAPLIYKAGLVLILQGNKTGYLGDLIFTYDADHYLVLSLPLPFDCATHASPDNPLLGLFIDIDITELNELSALLDNALTDSNSTTLGVQPVALDTNLRQALQRLLNALETDAAARALGPGMIRELLFHALNGPHGAALRALTQTGSHYERISRTIIQIRENYAQPFTVEDMAQQAGMSAPVFHRAFKSITGSSPHQYLRTTRLHRAKGLIVSDGLPVGEAARQVGYDNPAHFSREFKKHFHVSPKAAQNSGYMPIDI